MALFCTSYGPSLPNTDLLLQSASSYSLSSFPASAVSSLASHSHENFTRFLQHAQALGVRILPLVWEPDFEKLGLDGATGSVNESRLNARLAFAFKRFRPDVTDPRLSEAQFRDQQYSAIINEMKILSRPSIKDHDNIAVFIGVGFELFPATGQVWPVLIFSRFNRGDLASFMLLSQDLDAEIRLGICGEVAKAVEGLHGCNVVHGDLKPQNILINEDKTEDAISVGLTDFGFSSFSNSEDGLVRVPISQPWEAPEWHLREFSLADAKKMDMYSFGLICLWMFFRGEDLSDISLPGATVDMAFSGTNREATAAIQALKQNGDAMLQWSLQLLDKNLNIQDHARACLQQIFRLTLLRCPSERNATVQVISRLLSNMDNASDQMSSDAMTTVATESIDTLDWHSALSIETLFFHLESCDYRIHSFLVRSLQQMAESVACQSCSKNAAFQLSLCYAFGFGVSQNDQECNAWLIRSGKEYSDITATIERIKQAEPDAAFLAGIAKIGYRTDLPSRYRQDGILPVAIDHYRSIIEARWRCFGPSHFSTLRLQGLLVKLLRWNNMQQEALELALEILEQGWLKKPADNVEMKSTVSLIYHELGDDFNAEAMEREVLNTYESEQWKGHTERLDSQSNLVDILISRGQYKDAIELGQSTVEECLAELGSYHTSTRASRRSLVAAHIRCGELTQAVRITEELVQSEEPKSKSDYVNPKLVEDVSILGLLYYRLDMIAPALRCYDRIQNWVEHNTANATYAVNSVNNQATKLIQQGAMKEAKVILENLLPECEKALGQETEETALVMGNLVFIYHSERNWEKAEPLGRAVIETRRLVLGPSHPNSITAMGNYRSMLLDQGKVTRAVEVANEEIECIREGKGSTNESIIDSILTIAGDFMTHKAFKETVVFLQRVIAMKGAEPRDPQQRILQAMALQSICYLHIGMLDEARQAIFILLVSFQDPFKEHLNTFVPELLRLAKTCLSMNHLVEGEQVLVGATIISQKSTNLRDVVKDELKAVLSQYLERKGLESMQLSFNPYVVMDLSKQERRGGEQNFEERQIH